MGAKILGVALLVGLSLLSSSRVLAQPAGCTSLKVLACYAGFQESNLLRPLLTLTEGNEFEAHINSLFGNPKHFEHLCNEWNKAFTCLEPLEETCGIGTQYESFTQLFDLDLPIYPVAQQRLQWETVCSSEFMCASKISNCSAENPLPETPSTSDPAFCSALEDMYDCWDSHGHCKAYPDHQINMKSIRLGLLQCEALYSCQGVLGCSLRFSGELMTSEGMDGTTCITYRSYTQCVGDAIVPCSGVDELVGDVDPAVVSSYVERACTAMGKVDEIYACGWFTDCVGNVTSSSEFLYPEHFCRTIQGIMGCAVRAAIHCGNVPSSDGQDFVSQITELMLEAQAVGCGMAHVYGEGCEGLIQCVNDSFSGLDDDDDDEHDDDNAGHDDDDNTDEDDDDDDSDMEGHVGEDDFDNMCMAIHHFLSCADEKVENCDLDKPKLMPKNAIHVPELDDLSDIAGKMCNAMRGTDLSTCRALIRCIDYRRPPLSNGWEIMNGHAWCGYMVHVTECALSLSRTCPPKSKELKEDLMDIYDDLIKAGCKDMYGHVQRTTSGVLPQASVGWMGMLLSLLFLGLL